MQKCNTSVYVIILELRNVEQNTLALKVVEPNAVDTIICRTYFECILDLNL